MPVFTPELIARHAATAQPSTPAPAPERSHTPMHLALGVLGAGQAADAISTIAALKRAGTEEANPAYGKHPSTARIVGTKAAINLPSALLLDHLYNKQPKLAMGLALGLGGLGMALAAKNSQAGR